MSTILYTAGEMRAYHERLRPYADADELTALMVAASRSNARYWSERYNEATVAADQLYAGQAPATALELERYNDALANTYGEPFDDAETTDPQDALAVLGRLAYNECTVHLNDQELAAWRRLKRTVIIRCVHAGGYFRVGSVTAVRERLYDPRYPNSGRLGDWDLAYDDANGRAHQRMRNVNDAAAFADHVLELNTQLAAERIARWHEQMAAAEARKQATA